MLVYVASGVSYDLRAASSAALTSTCDAAYPGISIFPTAATPTLAPIDELVPPRAVELRTMSPLPFLLTDVDISATFVAYAHTS